MTTNLKKIITIGSVCLLFLIIIGYSYYRSEDLLRGVKLEINGITDGQAYGDPIIKMNGIAKNAKNLQINGREIFLDKEWNWQEQILLQKGYNIITIKAEDKFGKIKEKNYKIINN